MKTYLMALTAPLALAATPLSAQDDSDRTAEKFGQLFRADALTAEQEARLPAAEKVVAQAFPPGTYRRMMDTSMQPMMDAMVESMKAMPMAQLAAVSGMSTTEIEALGEASVGEIMDILDPAFEERMSISNRLTMSMVSEIMDEIEPAYRRGLTRAYAVRFTGPELADISAFFATETGRKYAPESILLFTDPQVMSVMGEMMPAIMERMPAMTEEMTAAMAELPQPKKVEDLTDAEREELAKILGVDVDEMRFPPMGE